MDEAQNHSNAEENTQIGEPLNINISTANKQ
jgi:hypothetical protein